MLEIDLNTAKEKIAAKIFKDFFDKRFNMNANGIVEAISRQKNSLKLSDGETWYGCFPGSEQAKSLEEVNKGDTVEIEYLTNTKGGRTYYNVKGITVTETGGGLPSGSGGSVKGNGSYSGGFPLSPVSEKRTMIRANSMTNAVAICSQLDLSGPDPITMYEAFVLPLAKKIERYESGDDDRSEAEANKSKTTEEILSDVLPDPAG